MTQTLSLSAAAVKNWVSASSLSLVLVLVPKSTTSSEKRRMPFIAFHLLFQGHCLNHPVPALGLVLHPPLLRVRLLRPHHILSALLPPVSPARSNIWSAP